MQKIILPFILVSYFFFFVRGNKNGEFLKGQNKAWNAFSTDTTIFKGISGI